MQQTNRNPLAKNHCGKHKNYSYINEPVLL